MSEALRSEYRKLFTIRSTYIISGLALLLVGFISFWVMGYKGASDNPHLLMDAATMTGQAISLFMTILAILLITHEYRYNTIMYTLTSSNRRSKALLSKAIVVSVYVVA
ncbi:MAG: ABC transporter permease, partial [Patescibacteria group bacterium]